MDLVELAVPVDLYSKIVEVGSIMVAVCGAQIVEQSVLSTMTTITGIPHGTPTGGGGDGVEDLMREIITTIITITDHTREDAVVEEVEVEAQEEVEVEVQEEVEVEVQEEVEVEVQEEVEVEAQEEVEVDAEEEGDKK
jgi:hypothetical protein